MYKDPYQVLGLSPDSTSDEVKKKYRTLVKQYHPDLHPDDAEAAEKMSEINAAYERINSGDVYNNNNYSQPSSGSRTAPSGSYTDNGTTYYYRYSDMEDIFRTFFGSFDFSGFSSNQNINEEYQRIEMYLSRGDYYHAIDILGRINVRDAKWNYYAARACEEAGRFTEAFVYAQNAYCSEPGNMEYKRLYEQIDSIVRNENKRKNRVRKVFSAAAVFMLVMMAMQILRPIMYLMLT